jgi:hypothetical protein
MKPHEGRDILSEEDGQVRWVALDVSHSALRVQMLPVPQMWINHQPVSEDWQKPWTKNEVAEH